MGFKDWIKTKDENASGDATEVPAPVEESMLWICEKCGMKLADQKDDNPSRRLQKTIKGMLSEQSRKHKVRAMVTSCMNICPKEKYAACLVHFGKAPPTTRFFEIEPSRDVEITARLLLQKLDE